MSKTYSLGQNWSESGISTSLLNETQITIIRVDKTSFQLKIKRSWPAIVTIYGNILKNEHIYTAEQKSVL